MERSQQIRDPKEATFRPSLGVLSAFVAAMPAAHPIPRLRYTAAPIR